MSYNKNKNKILILEDLKMYGTTMYITTANLGLSRQSLYRYIHQSSNNEKLDLRTKIEKQRQKMVELKKTVNEFRAQYKEHINKYYDRPPVLTQRVWINPKHEQIERKVEMLIKEKGQGMVGYHGTPYWKEFVQQANSNPEGKIRQQVNEEGYGLFIGATPGVAHHYTNAKVILKIVTTNKMMTPDRDTGYGNATDCIIPGTGDAYLLAAYEVNEEHKEWIEPPYMKTKLDCLRAAYRSLNSDITE